jgi:glycosyltransferase involved in cell wall biosynthesis
LSRQTTTPVRWHVAVPWILTATEKWRLTQFVPNEDAALDFHVVPASYTHDRSRKYTGVREWQDYLRHGNQAWSEARETRGPAGVITSFPQLPIIVGMRKRLAFSDMPLVAWTFNLGKVYPGMKRRLSQAALPRVDRFVVHSRGEIAAYSEWLDIPPERFQFVPFETPVRTVEFAEDLANPFVLSMGSAQRDYRLLFGVLAELGYPAVVVAGPHAVAGSTVPPNVTVRSGLTPQQCFELVQRARFNVIPVANQTTASGQVTLLDAMMYGRPAIITSCPASIDYVTHGKDALLVRMGDHDDMKAAVQRLWEDEALRRSLGTAARQTALQMFSEEVIGRTMGQILREVSSTRH